MVTTPKTIGLAADLPAYLVAHGSPPDPVLSRLIGDTEARRCEPSTTWWPATTEWCR